MKRRYLTIYPALNQMVLLEMQIESLRELKVILDRITEAAEDWA